MSFLQTKEEQETELEQAMYEGQWQSVPKLIKNLSKQGKPPFALIATTTGELRLLKGATEEAKGYFKSALEAEPGFEYALASLAQLELQEKSPQQAMDYLTQINWRKTESFWLGEASKTAPHRFKVLLEALVTRGNLQEAQGLFDSALLSYTDAWSLVVLSSSSSASSSRSCFFASRAKPVRHLCFPPLLDCFMSVFLLVLTGD